MLKNSSFKRLIVTLLAIIGSLARAKDDKRVLGLVARLGTGELSMAHAQEIRDAIIDFRDSGKSAIAFSETFGELTGGLTHYYLATAFDSLYLQPSGDLGLIGIAAESPFFKNLLDKIDVTPHLDHRYEYKNAMNLFAEEEFTDTHREATEKVMHSMYQQCIRAIADFRSMSENDVHDIISRGPYIANEALEHGLIDGLAYRDECMRSSAIDSIKMRAIYFWKNILTGQVGRTKKEKLLL